MGEDRQKKQIIKRAGFYSEGGIECPHEDVLHRDENSHISKIREETVNQEQVVSGFTGSSDQREPRDEINGISADLQPEKFDGQDTEGAE